MKTALRLLLAPYRFSVDRLFRMGEVGWAHWFDDPNTLYRRRNRLTYTRDFANAAWTKTNATITSDADGTADKLIASATTSTHVINQSVAVAGVPAVQTVRAKAAEYSWIAVNLGGSHLAYFDLTNGATGTVTAGATATITAASDAPGYYDCALSVPACGTVTCQTFLATANGVVSFLGDGTSGVLIARQQVETYTTTATEYQDVPTTWAQAYLDAVGAERIYAWKDPAGTIPNTAVGEGIGLLLGREYGGARGSNRITTTDLNNVAWFSGGGFGSFSGSTVSGNTITGTGTSGARSFRFSVSPGETIEFMAQATFVAAGGATSAGLRMTFGTSGAAAIAGSVTEGVGVTAGGGLVRVQGTAPATAAFCEVTVTAFGLVGSQATFANMVARTIPGTHLIQATGTARPTLSARVNLLTYTEQFDNAAWSKSSATVTANATTDPLGGSTADKIIASAATAVHNVVQTVTLVASTSYVYSVDLKAAEYGWAIVYIGTAGAGKYINLSTGATGGNFIGAPTSCTTRDRGNGWWRVTMTFSSGAGGASDVRIYPTTADGTSSFLGDGTSGIYAWGADLRTADDAAKNIPAYQRVGATAADHDTEGFPHGQYPDGTDDNQTTTTGGGGTTGFFYCGAITVSGGAGTARTIWSDTGTNTGYRVRINSSNKLELAAGNGSAYTTVESNETVTAPGTYLLSAWDDGGVLAVQVNNFAPATTTRPTVSAGTAAITVYKDNGAASSYLNGRDYGSVYRQSYIGESQHARLKRWLADRARITL